MTDREAFEEFASKHWGAYRGPDSDIAWLAWQEAWRAALRENDAEIERLRKDKDGAYLERNRLVALLAGVYPSGIKRTAIEGWSDDWHGCVYIDFPWGQASWHYHDSQAHLFAHLPPYQGEWDGHTTDEKYARMQYAKVEPIGAEVEALRGLLKEAHTEMKHARIFIMSREKMHPVGAGQFDVALARIDAKLKETP